MARRRKDKVKEAKAREAERLAAKNGTLDEHIAKRDSRKKKPSHIASNAVKNDERTGTVDANPDAPSVLRRLKDSRGRKIPTEEERRAKGDIGTAAEAVKTAEKSATTEPPEKVNKSNSKKNSAGIDVRRVKKRKDNKSASEKIKLAFWTAAAHPFIVCLVVVVAIIAGVAIYGIVEQNTPADIVDSEDAKTISLIGMTEPAKAVLDDTGKFDGFFTDDENGVGYADLFDYDITPEEQEILADRGQAIDENGTFTYNEDISSAKDAKEQAEKNAAAQSDAGTALSIAQNQLQQEAQSAE